MKRKVFQSFQSRWPKNYLKPLNNLINLFKGEALYLFIKRKITKITFS